MRLLNTFKVKSTNKLKVGVPVNNIKIFDIDYEFEKYFKRFDNFIGRLDEIRKGTKENKYRICIFSDGNILMT